MSFSLTVRSNAVELDRQPCEDVTFEEARHAEFYQPKYDGIWGCLFRSFDHVAICSRNGNIKGHYRIPAFPHDTVVVGEYMFGTQWANDQSRAGKFFAYDLLFLHGYDLRKTPYKERYEQLAVLLAELSFDTIQLVKNYPIPFLDQTLKTLNHTRAYEGVVTRYWSNTFSDTLGRIKLAVEDDFIITGYKRGQNSFSDTLGALVVSAYTPSGDLVEVMDVGGGLSKALRDDIWKNPQKYLNQVITCEGRGRFNSGALRHPNFVRFRDDKYPKECILLKRSILQTGE